MIYEDFSLLVWDLTLLMGNLYTIGIKKTPCHINAEPFKRVNNVIDTEF